MQVVDFLVVVVFCLFSELVIALLTITIRSAKSCITSRKPELLLRIPQRLWFIPYVLSAQGCWCKYQAEFTLGINTKSCKAWLDRCGKKMLLRQNFKLFSLFKKSHNIIKVIKFYMRPSAIRQTNLYIAPMGEKYLYKSLIMVTVPAHFDHHKHFLLLCNK